MRKNFIATALFILSTNCFAQVSVNATDIPSVNKVDIYETNNIAGFSVGSSGTNQIWNYTALSTALVGDSEVISLSQATNAANFPEANYCVRNTFTTNGNYTDFYSVSTTSFNFLGSVSSLGSDKLSNNIMVFQFPYSFGSIINDTYQFLNDSSLNSFSSEYDASGSLSTPFGTYNNVVRVKITRADSNFTKYDWYQTAPFKLVMSVTMNNSNPNSNSITLYKANTLGVNESDKEILLLYPNPTSAKIYFNFEAKKVNIFDTTGKQMDEIFFAENVKEINIKSYPAGIYFLKISKDDQTFVMRKIIKE